MKTNIHFRSHLAVLLIIKNISGKSIEKLETHILCSITCFENRAFYEIMWKNFVEQGSPRRIIWRMRTACWVPTATNAHTFCVILFAIPLQQWLNKRVSMLRCTYISRLVRPTNGLHALAVYFQWLVRQQ
jgi:hypothetical protein